MKNLGTVTIFLSTLFTPVHPMSAEDWTLTSAPVDLPWQAVASSADGTKLVAAAGSSQWFPTIVGPICISTNSGTSWQVTSAPWESWHAIASSADGTRLAAAVSRGPIYVSTNSGGTWTATSVTNASWNSIASSADGNRLIAVANGYGTLYDNGTGPIYISTNGGTTWNRCSVGDSSWLSVATSADGSKLAASASSVIFVSSDSGATWTSCPSTYSPLHYYRAVTSSRDGHKLVAAGPSYIITSTNAGATWYPANAPSLNWWAMTSSADGEKLAVVSGNSGASAISTDSGAVWTLHNTAGGVWQSVASSADGNKLVAAAERVGIFTWQATPNPRLLITSSNGGVRLSWIVPSASFVLQQNSDLNTTNWITVSNSPVLNLTNLQHEVTLSPTVGNCYYRLHAQ